jgi:hypothetical protein
MPMLPKAELQANIPLETMDAQERKRELEDHIKTVDSRHDLLTESAAQRDIEAYKSCHGAAQSATRDDDETTLKERGRDNESRK